MVTLTLNEAERLLWNPALFTVCYAHFAPFFEAAIEDFDLASLVKNEEIVTVVGWCTLDCNGWRNDNSASMNLLEILLLQGTNVGKYGDEQKQNCR